jgi:L-lactate dehydrogenase complex protein LldG
MSEARKRILERLRKGAARPALHPPATAEREAEWLALQPALGDLTERFIAGQKAVGGKVIRVADWAALPEAIAPWMREYQVSSAITGVVPALEPLRRYLAQRLGILVRTYDRAMEEQGAELWETECGITTAEAGIADTGSLAIRPTPEEPRLLSLSVPIHLVLLERARLYGRLHDYLRTGDYQARLPSNWFLVTGASRTADIEQTLTIGVHGPKVFLVALIG